MKRRVIVAAVMVAVGVGAAGYAVFGPGLSKDAAATYFTATAAKTNVVASVVATGSVSPTASYGLAFGADPDLITSRQHFEHQQYQHDHLLQHYEHHMARENGRREGRATRSPRARRSPPRTPQARSSS